MRAKLAGLMTKKYRVLQDSDDIEQLYLWKTIYPAITRAVQLGQTAISVQAALLPEVDEVLREEGYAIRTEASLTFIDWSFQTQPRRLNER